MAFVKDANFDVYKRVVETNFNALEDRVLELEKLLKQYNGGTPVEEVVPEPEVVEEEIVEEEIIPDEVVEEDDEEEEDGEDIDEDEDSEPIAKPIVKQDGKKTK